MPLYDYKCAKCEKVFEVHLKFAEVDAARPKCPACGSRQAKRQIRLALATRKKSRNRLTLDQFKAATALTGGALGVPESGAEPGGHEGHDHSHGHSHEH